MVELHKNEKSSWPFYRFLILPRNEKNPCPAFTFELLVTCLVRLVEIINSAAPSCVMGYWF